MLIPVKISENEDVIFSPVFQFHRLFLESIQEFSEWLWAQIKKLFFQRIPWA